MKSGEVEKETLICASSGWVAVNLREFWEYRDLIMLMVARDFTAKYRQTVLGPAWFVIQPLLMTLVFTVVFGRIAKMPTDGVPPFVFYLCGQLGWNYFAGLVHSAGNTFVQNSGTFTRVYFPRLIIPITTAASQLVTLSIQIVTFLSFYFFYWMFGESGDTIRPDWRLWLFPALIIQAGLTGLGVAFLTSSVSAKYRDFTFLLGFVVQLWMYATPIIYPLSEVPEGLRWVTYMNPMASVVELVKAGFFGRGGVGLGHGLGSALISLGVFIFGLFVFRRTERRFVDTV